MAMKNIGIYGLTLLAAAQLSFASPKFTASKFSVKTDQLSEQSGGWKTAVDALKKARDEFSARGVLNVSMDLTTAWISLGGVKFPEKVSNLNATAEDIAAFDLLNSTLERLKAIIKHTSTEQPQAVLDDAYNSALVQSGQKGEEKITYKEEKKENTIIPKEEKKETVTPEVKKEEAPKIEEKETAVPKEEKKETTPEKKEEQAPVKEEKKEIAFENTQESQLAAIRSLNTELSAANSEKKLVAVIDQFGSMLDRAKGTMSMEVVKGFSEFFFALNDRADEFGGLADSKHTELKGKLDAELKRVLSEQKKIDNTKKDETKEAPKEEKREPVKEQPKIEEKEELKVEKTETAPKIEEKKEETVVPKKEEAVPKIEEKKEEQLKVEKTETAPKEEQPKIEEKEEAPKREEELKVLPKQEETVPEKKEEIKIEKKEEKKEDGTEKLKVKKTTLSEKKFDEAKDEFYKVYTGVELTSSLADQFILTVNELIDAAKSLGDARKDDLKKLDGTLNELLNARKGFETKGDN